MNKLLSFTQPVSSSSSSSASPSIPFQPGNRRPVVIVNGGPPPETAIAKWIPTPAYVIAVDRGYEHAVSLGVTVDELIGDFDSLDPAILNIAKSNGVRTVQHPTDKDATDLDLALQRAMELNARDITVICGEGWEDRFDHVGAQLGLLANPAFAAHSVVAWFGSTFVSPVHPGRPLRTSGTPGETISMLAIGGPVTGVRTTGLRYALTGDTLNPFSTRSVSNEFSAHFAAISVESGALLVIIPEALNTLTAPNNLEENS
jgi:thiamine pyrophosphokinase